jgi:REP element-mobilizing transposase RayT
MPAPLAYFLSWRCYGTWLRGDSRGAVDAFHNKVNTPKITPNRARVASDQSRMASESVSLSAQEQTGVEAIIRRHADFRGWGVLAVHVGQSHVHVVVQTRSDKAPEQVMTEFKAWATRALRELGTRSENEAIWAEHGSTRWINDPETLAAAVDYVTRLQAGPHAQLRLERPRHGQPPSA